MTAQNINIITILIFLIVSWALIFLTWKTYKYKKENYKKLDRIYPNYRIGTYKMIALIASFIIALFSIFQIKWKEIDKKIETKWVDIMFTLDVSKSMNTADVDYGRYKTTRLNVAKKAIEDYVVKHPNNRYWLVIFAGEAQSIIPLTSDKNVFLTLLAGVDYKNLTQQGTNFNDALAQTFARFKDKNKWKVMVFISDGWDEWDYKWIDVQIPKWLKSIVIWVWTTKWWKIILWQNAFWEYKYQTYNWHYVITKLNEKNLQKLANDLWWKYIQLDNIDKINQIDNYIKNLSKQAIISSAKERQDLTRYLLIISFILFLVYLGLEIQEIWRLK